MNRKKSSTFQLVRYVALGAVVGGLVLSLNYSRASVGPQVVKAVRGVQPGQAPVPMGLVVSKDTHDVRATYAADPAAPVKTVAPKAHSQPAPAPQPNVSPASQPDASPAPQPGVAQAPQAQSGLVIQNRTGGEDPLYLLNDRLITKGEMSSLNPNDIESVSVFKGAGITDDVVAQYGEKARNGIVAIYTRTWAATGKKRFSAASTTTIAGAGTAASGNTAAFTATGQDNGGRTTNVTRNVKINANANTNSYKYTNVSTNTYSNVNVKIVAEGNPAANITSENAVSVTADKITVQDKKNTQNTTKQ